MSWRRRATSVDWFLTRSRISEISCSARALLVYRHAVTEFLDLPFDLMGQGVGCIPSLDFFAAPTVFFGVGLRVAYHAIYVLLR